MKRIAIILVSSAVFAIMSRSQSCLPEGIFFFEQQQIDNFQINYPGCTSIEGNVTINGYDISDLNGLISLTHIGGSLKIGTGEFGGNYSLSSLEGLGNLASIGGTLEIKDNSVLNSLSGLESLSSIGGDLNIIDNTALTTLFGLDNLSAISGNLLIWYNDSLTSLTGLNSLDAASVSHLTIGHNNSLSDCDVQGICNYLSSPNGIVRIFSNSPGCSNPPEIAEQCGIQLSCLPYGDYLFESQARIDSFQADYSNCTQLSGEVYLHGSDIDNLNGLIEIVSIGGTLDIYDNPALSDLEGLDNLESVGDYLLIGFNDNLIQLTGLGSLENIGGTLNIQFNEALISLNGLEGLKRLNGHCLISSNDSLQSLAGIDNIDAETITGLSIDHNHSLSICEVQSICDYLANPNGFSDIYDNDSGCDSVEEVEEACESISVREPGYERQFEIYPNPANQKLFISNHGFTGIIGINVYNISGQKVYTQEGTVRFIDVTVLGPGLYFLELITRETTNRLKFIVR